MAVCAGAVRRWLIEHDELPAGPLVAQVPISVRTEEQRGTFGNRIGVMSVPLYTEEPDPVERLRRRTKRCAPRRSVTRRCLRGCSRTRPSSSRPRCSRAPRAPPLAGRRPRGRPIWNLVISNVPGPQVPLYCAGAQVQAMYPVSVVSDGVGLNITVFSYCGHIDVGIVADRDQMPDVWKLIGWLQDSLDELEGAPSRGSASRARLRESLASDLGRVEGVAQLEGKRGSSRMESRSASSAAHSIGIRVGAATAITRWSSARSGRPASASKQASW